MQDILILVQIAILSEVKHMPFHKFTAEPVKKIYFPTLRKFLICNFIYQITLHVPKWINKM